MTKLFGICKRRPLAALILGLWILGACAPRSACFAQENPSLAAIAVFMEVGDAQLPAEAREVRLAAGELLADALGNRGVRVCEPAAVRELMQRWRVRSGANLKAGFLEELGSTCGVDRLLVAQLIYFSDGFVLACRAVETATGDLSWVELAEGRGGGTWQDQLAGAAAELSDRWAEPRQSAGLETILVMPAAGVGVSEAQKTLYSLCALRVLSRAAAWRLPDPGFVAAELGERGIDSHQLSAEARAGARARFDSRLLIQSDLISYPAGGGHGGGGVAAEADGIFSGGFVEPFYFVCRFVDAESGIVKAGGDWYLSAADTRGPFGTPRLVSRVERFGDAAESLLEPIMERQEED